MFSCFDSCFDSLDYVFIFMLEQFIAFELLLFEHGFGCSILWFNFNFVLG